MKLGFTREQREIARRENRPLVCICWTYPGGNGGMAIHAPANDEQLKHVQDAAQKLIELRTSVATVKTKRAKARKAGA